MQADAIPISRDHGVLPNRRTREDPLGTGTILFAGVGSSFCARNTRTRPSRSRLPALSVRGLQLLALVAVGTSRGDPCRLVLPHPGRNASSSMAEIAGKDATPAPAATLMSVPRPQAGGHTNGRPAHLTLPTPQSLPMGLSTLGIDPARIAIERLGCYPALEPPRDVVARVRRGARVSPYS